MGATNPQASRFHYTSLQRRVPTDDPLRAIEAVIDWDLIRDKLAPSCRATGRVLERRPMPTRPSGSSGRVTQAARRRR